MPHLRARSACRMIMTTTRPRCGSTLHRRKPNAVSRAWALLIAAAILYVPANVYPPGQFIQLGSGEPSTILGGVELLDGGMWPLAALVFFASVAVLDAQDRRHGAAAGVDAAWLDAPAARPTKPISR